MRLIGIFVFIMCLSVFSPATALAECDLCGDLTGDGSVDISDLTAFMDWILDPAKVPACPCAADLDCDGAITANLNNVYDPSSDLGYLITYMFFGGNEPCDPDGDGILNCDWCN